jgi:hypothetical protein
MRYSSPHARCRPHTASPDLSIVWPLRTRPVPDHRWSSAPGLLLLPRSLSLPAMSHLSLAHDETSKRDSPHETKRKVKLPKCARFEFKPRQVNYSSHTKSRYWPLGFSTSRGRKDWLPSRACLGRCAHNVTLIMSVLMLLSRISLPRRVPLVLGPVSSPTLAGCWRNAKSFFACRRLTWRCERQYWRRSKSAACIALTGGTCRRN